jgi:hypothetical protein
MPQFPKDNPAEDEDPRLARYVWCNYLPEQATVKTTRKYYRVQWFVTTPGAGLYSHEISFPRSLYKMRIRKLPDGGQQVIFRLHYALVPPPILCE